MFGGFGLPELLIILLIVLLVFGVGKLPELGSALGKGVRGFRKSMEGGSEDPRSEDRDQGQGGQSSDQGRDAGDSSSR